MVNVNEIIAQTEVLKREYETYRKIESDRDVYEKKTQYQREMTTSLKTANTYILFFYYFLFILIHGLFAEQYFRGIQRNEMVDAVVFTGFFVYPAIIYYLESYLYFGISYVLAYIYGKTYVYQFDQMLTGTNFYQDPSELEIYTKGTGLPNMTVNLT